MIDAGTALEQECRALCEYLVGVEPSDYVIGWYLAGHRSIPYAREGGKGPDRFDRYLLALARRRGPFTRIADAYARILRPRSVLRQKLILLLAILENCPPTHQPLNSARAGSKPVLFLILAGAAGGFLAALLSGILLAGPVHLACALVPPDHRPSGAADA